MTTHDKNSVETTFHFTGQEIHADILSARDGIAPRIGRSSTVAEGSDQGWVADQEVAPNASKPSSKSMSSQLLKR